MTCVLKDSEQEQEHFVLDVLLFHSLSLKFVQEQEPVVYPYIYPYIKSCHKF